VHCQDHNWELLKWWQSTAYKKNPLLKLYKDINSLPEGIMNTDDAGRQKARGKSLSDMRAAKKLAKANAEDA
jgi:hypothetical protein